VEIHRLLVDMVDRRHVAPGMVIGIAEASGRRRIIAYGRWSPTDPRPVDGDTLFEIGSITKLFTAVLLTDMVRRGEVGLEDPAEKYAPPGMVLPRWGGREITLLDLVTHTSGLPNFPDNLGARSPLNPFADYHERRLDAFLSGYRLRRSPGAVWEYSSLGAGLLGNLLARRADTDYEVLLKNRVLNPLGMGSTAVLLLPDQQRRLAPGHTAGFAPAPTGTCPRSPAPRACAPAPTTC
jgi:CubicO group peptidase (beta-lactamase class C family)